MRERQFEFGPLSRGTFIALICMVPLVPYVRADLFLHYVVFLVLLGFGTRPLLERTGLYRTWATIEGNLLEKWDRKHLERRRREIDRKVRDDKLRQSRYRDPKLPRNW